MVVPILKSGDSTDVNNYRPISILPIFSTSKFKKNSENNHFELLDKNQYGFRKKNISTTHLML